MATYGRPKPKPKPRPRPKSENQVLVLPRMNGRGALMRAWLEDLKKANPGIRIATPKPKSQAWERSDLR